MCIRDSCRPIVIMNRNIRKIGNEAEGHGAQSSHDFRAKIALAGFAACKRYEFVRITVDAAEADIRAAVQELRLGKKFIRPPEKAECSINDINSQIHHAT